MTHLLNRMLIGSQLCNQSIHHGREAYDVTQLTVILITKTYLFKIYFNITYCISYV
jgi:hypothetical protein